MQRTKEKNPPKDRSCQISAELHGFELRIQGLWLRIAVSLSLVLGPTRDADVKADSKIA